MREDYWASAQNLRLPITKAGKKKLAMIQRVYFPSFSQSSLVKILIGVVAKDRGITERLVKKKVDPLPDPPPSSEYVEVVDCTEDELRLIAALLGPAAKDGNAAGAWRRLLPSIVDSF
jgi:hypothetical protein